VSEPPRHRDIEDDRLNAVTSKIIGAAIEVHRILGPGLLESMYETALCIELEVRGLTVARQVLVPAYYRGRLLGNYRVDLVVADLVVVEVKCVVVVAPVCEAQLLTYMRLTGKRVGLLLNFHSPLLREGITRRVL
jgi:GxxExxY protein